MKKKILALTLCVVMLAVAVTGATLAYFTDQDDAQNVFTVGDLDIELKEAGKVELGKVDQSEDKLVPNTPKGDGDDDGYKYVNLVPGNKITKTPTITNIGENPAYVRVAVVMNNLHEINTAIDEVYENLTNPDTDQPYTEQQIQDVYDDVFEGWDIVYTKDKEHNHNNRMWIKRETGDKLLAVDMAAEYKGDPVWWNIDNENEFQNDIDEATAKTDGTTYTEGSYYDAAIDKGERVYVYYLALKKGESYDLFTGLNVPDDFDSNRVMPDDTIIDQMAMFQNLTIDIEVDAIQQEGFDTWQDAIAALEAAHPLGSDYYRTYDEVTTTP